MKYPRGALIASLHILAAIICLPLQLHASTLEPPSPQSFETKEEEEFLRAFTAKDAASLAQLYTRATPAHQHYWRSVIRATSDFSLENIAQDEQRIILLACMGLEADEGTRLLNTVFQRGFTSGLRALMEAGVPLHAADESENLVAKPNSENSSALLSEALLEPAKVHAKPSGKTALMRGVLSASPAFVAQLLTKPEDCRLAARDGWQMTALMYAAKFGDTELCTLLIAAGSPLEGRDLWGKTAYMLAAEGGYTETQARLRAAGARTDLRDIRGLSAIDLAYINGFTLGQGENAGLEDSSETSDSSASVIQALVGEPGAAEQKSMRHLRFVNKGRTIAGATVGGLLGVGMLVALPLSWIAAPVGLALVASVWGPGLNVCSWRVWQPLLVKRNFKKLAKLLEASYMQLGMLPAKTVEKHEQARQRLVKFWHKYILAPSPDSPLTLDMVAAQFVYAHSQELFTKFAVPEQGIIKITKKGSTAMLRISRSSHSERDGVLRVRQEEVKKAQIKMKGGAMKGRLANSLFFGGMLSEYCSG